MILTRFSGGRLVGLGFRRHGTSLLVLTLEGVV